MLSGHTGSGVCTENPATGYLRTARGSHDGQESILRRHIKPAALRVGVGKIGWHTFRHSYSSLLRRVDADIKIQHELSSIPPSKAR